MQPCLASLFFVVTLLAGLPASAADEWSEPAPGVSYLLRTAPGPLRMHAAVVDLTRDDLYIRATRPDERGATTSAFAQEVGAVVAINGDWFSSGYQPAGLAAGQGAHWEGTADSGWSFIACTVEKDCVYDEHTVNQELHWRWYDVVGGNGWRLVVDGQIPAYPPDAFYTALEPRSAVGTSADGSTMIFVVVEGRRADSIGVGFHDIAAFMQELGAHQALMLDGGGSSTLSIAQNRVNLLPSNQPAERVVANHLAILRGQPDAQCEDTPNGRYCTGSTIHTCQGGAHRGEGDCAAFGSTCDVTSDGVGVCTHPACVNGPEGSFCESDSIIVACDYGRPGPGGDCSAFGATCQDEEGAWCVHHLCTHGAHGKWCGEGEILHACTDGQPEDDIDCAATGQVCSDTLPGCVDPGGATAPDHDTGDGGGSDGGSDDGSDGDTDDGAPRGGPGGIDTDTAAGGCTACAASGPSTPARGWLLVLMGLVVRRRALTP